MPVLICSDIGLGRRGIVEDCIHLVLHLFGKEGYRAKPPTR